MVLAMRDATTPFVCPACRQGHRATALEDGEVACCRRCGEALRGSEGEHAAALPLALTGLACWGLALWLPLARVEKLGLANEGYLLGIGASFRANGQALLGWATDLALVALPSVLYLLLPWLLARGSMEAEGWAARVCGFARRWAMLEVFALAVLVAFLKIGALADAAIGPGFWFLGGATFVLILVLRSMALPLRVEGKCHAAAWAYLAAACVLLVPANVLPSVEVTVGGRTHRSTILQGAASLVSSGMWGIALIVFVASILVPFGKLGGLGWLLALARRKGGSRRAMSLYRALEFIGRWSMLDIFLIGTLAALVDFRGVALVTPGPAAPAFAGAVVMTVFAVERFDPRSLWPAREGGIFGNPTKSRTCDHERTA